jgi:hypothetical protein
MTLQKILKALFWKGLVHKMIALKKYTKEKEGASQKTLFLFENHQRIS